MTSTFSSLPLDLPDRILCYYVNSSTQIQKACISNIPNWSFERVVFPQQRLLFEAVPDALLEIHICSPLGETLCDRISCFHLKVSEGDLLTSSMPELLVTQTDLVEE